MVHLETFDGSIARAEGMDERAILEAIDGGARIVVFDMVVTLGTSYYVGRRRHLVRPGESPLRVAASATALTLFGGWWGLGILHTPGALHRNFSGGVDVTESVKLELAARLTAKTEKAEADRRSHAAASAPDASLDVRRARALALVERGDGDAAWSLVGEDVLRGEEIAQDVELLRRLLLALRAKRLWGRAATVGELIRARHPAEVKGYLATAIQEVEGNATRPDGYRPPTPLWVKVMLVLALVATIAFFAAGIYMDAFRR
jgi:hypothetical protein